MVHNNGRLSKVKAARGLYQIIVNGLFGEPSCGVQLFKAKKKDFVDWLGGVALVEVEGDFSLL